jgi:hypothetical protein
MTVNTVPGLYEYRVKVALEGPTKGTVDKNTGVYD